MRFLEKVNKILDQHFIMEGQNEDRALAMLKKAGKESAYDSLLELTSDKNNKNKHLPILAKFFLEGQSIDIIKNYYERFISNTKLNQKPIDNLTFQQFEQMVDSAVVSTNVKTKTLEDKPLYEDQNVKIYLGDTKEKCIKYGQGSKYGFCIARQDSSNLYWGYRSRGATFYFVYFKNSYAKADAPSDLIVIHAYPDEQYQVNYAIPNADHKKDAQEIVDEFPVLDGLLGKVIIDREFSEKEKKTMEINKEQDINNLKTLEEKLIWVEMGKMMNEPVFRKLKEKNDEKSFNEILKKYIEVGLFDIPNEFISGSKYENRYWEKVGQRLDAGISQINDEGIEREVKTIHDLFRTNFSEDEIVVFFRRHENEYSEDDLDHILDEAIRFRMFTLFKEVFDLEDYQIDEKSIKDLIRHGKNKFLNHIVAAGVDISDFNTGINMLTDIVGNKDDISKEALSQLIDGFGKFFKEQNYSTPSIYINKGIVRELENRNYQDLKQKYLSIFQETK
jgi:predicted CopG family antitoxin